jgi:hypothetical protein
MKDHLLLQRRFPPLQLAVLNLKRFKPPILAADYGIMRTYGAGGGERISRAVPIKFTNIQTALLNEDHSVNLIQLFTFQWLCEIRCGWGV